MNTTNWVDSSWKHLSLVSDEEVISLLHTMVYVFSHSVLCLEKMNENPKSNIAWEEGLTWFKSSPEYRALDRIDGEPMEFEWNIFPGFTTLELCTKVQELLSRLSVTPEKFTGRITFMSMFNDISWDLKTIKKNASQVLNSFLSMQRDLEQDNGHSSDKDQKRSGTLLVETVHKENGTELQSKWCWHFCRKHAPGIPIHESIIQRSAKKHRRWKIVNTLLRRPGNDWNCFSHNFCESAQYFRSSRRNVWRMWLLPLIELGRPFVEGQSDPLFVIVMKTHTPLTDDPAQPEEDLLQRYQERIEKLSQQDRVSKFCTDAGFLTTVEVGQYFMTKDTEEFSQFTDSVACRECILPIDESLSEPEGWIRGNTKIGPVLEVTTCCLQDKYGVEIRFKSMNRDHSHSWVRISHGLNKLVTNLTGRQRAGNLRNAVRRPCVKIECTCFCKPIKGQSKTTKTCFCQLIHKDSSYWWKNLDRYWTKRSFAHRLSSVEETDQSSSSW